MISYITGKIIDLDFTSVTILTSAWVGYDIGINELTYSKIAMDKEENMYIYHHITENNQTLFWFLDKAEKQVFSELIKISGVWWKVAMQILSLGIERLLVAIQGEDNKTIQGIKWIWKKMAEKIILELKDKDFGIIVSSAETLQKAATIPADLQNSIKSTLTNMWYNPRDIDRVISELPEDVNDAWEIIPYVIKELS